MNLLTAAFNESVMPMARQNYNLGPVFAVLSNPTSPGRRNVMPRVREKIGTGTVHAKHKLHFQSRVNSIIPHSDGNNQLVSYNYVMLSGT